MTVKIISRLTGRLRESEDRFRLAFETGHTGMAVLTTEGKYWEVNKLFCEMLGYAEHEMLTKSWQDVSHPDDLENTSDLDLQLMAGEIDGFTQEKRFVTKNNDVVWVNLSCSAIMDGTDTPQFILGQYQDITEAKNNHDELVHARDQAEAANQAKTEFLSSMNHELRTPLTSSLGCLGLLKSLMAEDFSKQGQELLDIALRNNQALLRLINELLDYEKILSGTFAIETSPHDICALTSRIVKDLQGYAQTQSINFVFKGHPDPIYADVQEHRFEQILNNLLSNAAKFSEPGNDVEIFITKNSGAIYVNVKDRGPGIPEDFKEKIFEQFTQIDSSSTRKYNGTGLGLTISKALTKSMGGTLGFESEVGVGSTFYVSFSESSGSPQSTA